MQKLPPNKDTLSPSPSANPSLYSSTPSSYLLNSIDRASILSSQYFLQKRGKTFGSKQYRRFCIRQGKPYQVSLKLSLQQYKELPIPILILTEFRSGSKIWSDQCRDHIIRLYLEFAERSPVYIYFKNTLVSQEIRMFLISLAWRRDGINLAKFSIPFKKVIKQKTLDRIVEMATDKGGKYQKVRTDEQYNQGKMKAIYRLSHELQLNDPISNFMNQWTTKAELNQPPIIDTLRIKIQSVKIPAQLKLTNPSMKLWIVSENKQFPLLIKESQHRDHSIFVSSDKEVFTEIMGCNFNNQFQFEISEGMKKWKSERMKIIDLLRIGKKILRISFSSTQPYPSALIQLSLSPELQERFFVTQQPLPFTPSNYSVIQQLLGSSYDQNTKLNYQHHRSSLVSHSLRDSDELQLSRLSRYVQSLEISTLIDKCYSTQPYLKNLGSSHRGTLIYKYYNNLTKNIKYYDVQKILQQHNNYHQRRFYNSLKSFDNASRINFNSKLYYLIDKILKLVEMSPSVYWNDELFENTCVGRESVAFFIVIMLIYEIVPGYLLVGGKSLATNSLLMHYTTKIHLNTLYNKLSRLELNIETLFGMYSTSLLAELIEGQCFYKVLDAIILESKTKKYQYNLTLIGLFLSLLSRLDEYESVFETAPNFIFGLKVMALHITNQQQFCYNGDLFIEKMKKIIQSEQFVEISNEMKEFYKVQQNGVDIPSTMIQFFTQFPENQQKIENNYRQLHFCINKVEINTECPKLTLYLFQNKVRILQKQLSNQQLRQLHTNFGITLDSLNEIIIAVYQDQKVYTEFCQINPRKIPSNYMFQLCLPIQRSKKGLLDQSPCFICFQIVIKQKSTAVQSQSLLPQKYSKFFFDSQTYNKQIANLNNFASFFKMSPNNYNILYSKLGWFNNHYIIPEQLLVSIHRIENNDVLALPPSDINYYYHMNKYSRCMFGRAIVCSRDKSLFIQIVKNKIKFGMIHKYDAEKSKGSISSQLACYALENIKTFNPTYLQFFYNLMNLPLIDYLTYHSEYDILPDLIFDLFLGESRSAVVLSSESIELFQIFSQLAAAEIESNITYRLPRLKPKYTFSFPNHPSLSLDNFMYQLRLNILSSVIQQSSVNSQSLHKWPSHILIKANQLLTPLPNMKLHKFLTLIYQTKYTIVMEFSDQGRARWKSVNGLCFIKYYEEWKNVEVLCEINGVYKYYLVEEEEMRKRFVVKEEEVILLGTAPKVKIVCEEGDLTDQNSQLYKKIEKLF